MMKKILNKEMIDIYKIDNERVFFVKAIGGSCYEYNLKEDKVTYEVIPIKYASQIMYSNDEKTIFVSNTSGRIFLISKEKNMVEKKASYLYEPFKNNLCCVYNTFYYADRNGRIKSLSADETTSDLNFPDLSVAQISKMFDKLFVIEGKKYQRNDYMLIYSIVENDLVLDEKIEFPKNYVFDSFQESLNENKVIVAVEGTAEEAPTTKWLVVDLKKGGLHELGLEYSYKAFVELFGIKDALIEWQFDFERNLALFLFFREIFLIDLITNKVILTKKFKENTKCHDMEWFSKNSVLIATSDGVFRWDFEV